MQGAVIRMGGNANIAGAIAEGMAAAENERLKECIALLVAENERLKTELGLLKWHERQRREDRLCTFAERAKKAPRCPAWARIAIGLRGFVDAFR